MKDTIYLLAPIGLIFALVGAVVGIVVYLEPERAAPKFYSGSMVRTVVGGHVGQVVGVWCGQWCLYDVRFNGIQAHTDSRILSNDGPITIGPLGIVTNMREFELREVR